MKTPNRAAAKNGRLPVLNPGDLLSVTDASALIGWKPASLYRLAWSRGIRTFRVGRSLRFHRDDLLALIEERPAL